MPQLGTDELFNEGSVQLMNMRLVSVTPISNVFYSGRIESLSMGDLLLGTPPFYSTHTAHVLHGPGLEMNCQYFHQRDIFNIVDTVAAVEQTGSYA